MPDYAAMSRELPTLKRKLTVANHSGSTEKVLEAVELALNAFDRFGWPDNWSNWRRALDDAHFTYMSSDARHEASYGRTMDKFAELQARFY